MGLIERIKSALGLGTSGPASGEGPSPGDEVNVTVEHEPATASEDAVKGTDTASSDRTAPAETGTETGAGETGAGETGAGETAAETTGAAETVDEAEAAEEDQPSADLEDIKGIGPAYAERLREAGVSSVADLADADPADLGSRTDIAASRIENWVDRAGDL